MANTAKSFVPSLSAEVSTGTAVTNAVTLNAQLGVITSEALTTAQSATYLCTLTNSYIGTGSIVLASLSNGTNTQGTALMKSITPAAGSVAFLVVNLHPSAEALNGTIKISYVVL